MQWRSRMVDWSIVEEECLILRPMWEKQNTNDAPERYNSMRGDDGWPSGLAATIPTRREEKQMSFSLEEEADLREVLVWWRTPTTKTVMGYLAHPLSVGSIAAVVAAVATWWATNRPPATAPAPAVPVPEIKKDVPVKPEPKPQALVILASPLPDVIPERLEPLESVVSGLYTLPGEDVVRTKRGK